MFVGVSDKLPPKATCPKEDVGVVTDKRLLKVPFTEPTFTEHDKIAKNHQTGSYDSSNFFTYILKDTHLGTNKFYLVEKNLIQKSVS